MCRLRNIAMCDYQESVTTGQTDGRTDRQTPDKVIPMCHYALQATQKEIRTSNLVHSTQTLYHLSYFGLIWDESLILNPALNPLVT